MLQCVKVCLGSYVRKRALCLVSAEECCSVLQCGSVCCSVLEYAQEVMSAKEPYTLLYLYVVRCSVLQCVALHLWGCFRGSAIHIISAEDPNKCCSVLQYVAVCCSVLQCVAVCCSVLHCGAVCYSVLKCVCKVMSAK